MTSQTKRPPGRQAQTRFFRVLNVPMRMVLGLPFPTPLGGKLMLIFFTGRKTGKKYRQPVSYVKDGDVLLTPGGGRWKLNLRDGEPVQIRLRGSDLVARPELVADPDEIERLLAVMAVSNPRASAFVGIPKGPDGRLDRDRLLAAVKYGFRVVRWHVGEPGSGV